MNLRLRSAGRRDEIRIVFFSFEHVVYSYQQLLDGEMYSQTTHHESLMTRLLLVFSFPNVFFISAESCQGTSSRLVNQIVISKTGRSEYELRMKDERQKSLACTLSFPHCLQILDQR